MTDKMSKARAEIRARAFVLPEHPCGAACPKTARRCLLAAGHRSDHETFLQPGKWKLVWADGDDQARKVAGVPR